MISSPSPYFAESPVAAGGGQTRWAHEGSCPCGGSHRVCEGNGSNTTSTLFMGVVTGVKTLRRHPVLATVIWLLGGSSSEAEPGSPPTASSSMESAQSQERAADSPHDAAAASRTSSQPRRLRWTSAPQPPETKAGDRVVYYVDRETGQRGCRIESSGDHGGFYSCDANKSSQMIYPDTIKVEKYTHMDRVEMDDLEPAAGAVAGRQAPQQPQGCAAPSLLHSHALQHYNQLPALPQGEGQQAEQAAAEESADVSPQWGWYISLTPPQPEVFSKDAARTNKAWASDLRPSVI